MRPIVRALSAVLLLWAMTAGWVSVARAEVDAFAAARAQMLAEIQATAETVGRVSGPRAISPRVLEVMGNVPRHEFVPEDLRPWAYADRPLPIGHDQTISQPYIVALMTDLLAVAPTHRVLEVGTGSGYQAAVLSKLAAQVFSIEIVDALAEQAAQRLNRLGYSNVSVRAGDGYAGWETEAPYDRIIVTAAPPKVPPPLLAQLKAGGRMVIPVGAPDAVQTLMLVEKREDGTLLAPAILPVRFVPLTRSP